MFLFENENLFEKGLPQARYPARALYYIYPKHRLNSYEKGPIFSMYIDDALRESAKNHIFISILAIGPGPMQELYVAVNNCQVTVVSRRYFVVCPRTSKQTYLLLL